MRVTLIRHGEAGEAPRDEDRGLTRAGRKGVRRVAHVLAKRRVRFDIVITSPLVRATQTAEIVVEKLGFDGDVLISRALVPSASAETTAGLLEGLDEHARVALVGHEPNLSSLAEHFTRGRYGSLRKGEALRLRLNDGRGELRWRVVPEIGRLERLD